jgi:23S rRNA (cytidine1920-2'-O)/16S rRNA (cytidine1409-2'-O)-methyltransferase
LKERIDVLLVQQGYFETREKAKRALMAGLVLVDGQRIDKPGTTVLESVEIAVKGVAIPYVSRGGLKLEKAIRSFQLELQGLTCMDVGASTGGFTDCMLQSGAKKVYAVDVGYGQLDWKLRNDERVINLERTNIRHITREQVPETVNFISIDVAFISLKLVIPAIMTLLEEDGTLIMLIKPQFEAGREQVGKKGVVREAKVHIQVLNDVLLFSMGVGLELIELSYSPITGPNGNIEFLAYMKKSSLSSKSEHSYSTNEALATLVETVVTEAHLHLKMKP